MFRVWFVALASLLLVACAPASGAAQALSTSQLEGLASWYGPGFAGRLTANGEIFDPGQLTAAHKTLHFGSMVRVTNLSNGLSVVVRINDRGPFKPGRVIDLSRAAAERIDLIEQGVTRVSLDILSPETVDPGSRYPLTTLALTGLTGFSAISRQHAEGELLFISSPKREQPILVRVIGSQFPLGVTADLLLAPEVFELLGPRVRLHP